MTITEKDLDDIFEYHTPTTIQVERMQAIRREAKVLAKVILDNSPSSPDQTVALRRLLELVMIVNQSIIFNGRY